MRRQVSLLLSTSLFKFLSFATIAELYHLFLPIPFWRVFFLSGRIWRRKAINVTLCGAEAPVSDKLSSTPTPVDLLSTPDSNWWITLTHRQCLSKPIISDARRQTLKHKQTDRQIDSPSSCDENRIINTEGNRRNESNPIQPSLYLESYILSSTVELQRRSGWGVGGKKRKVCLKEG